ncbi:MAG: hypothetical protein MJ223_03775 [Mycoplasmoidaceae bacterium]|nr:hypothetical protein [Mycoplasmoidaceae bacterium]
MYKTKHVIVNGQEPILYMFADQSIDMTKLKININRQMPKPVVEKPGNCLLNNTAKP